MFEALAQHSTQCGTVLAASGWLQRRQQSWQLCNCNPCCTQRNIASSVTSFFILLLTDIQGAKARQSLDSNVLSYLVSYSSSTGKFSDCRAPALSDKYTIGNCMLP